MDLPKQEPFEIEIEEVRKRRVTLDPQRVLSGPVGLVAENVAVCATVNVVACPYLIFRGNRIAVAPSCAPYFVICDVRIGRDSMFFKAEELSAELFPPIPFGLSDAQRARVETMLRQSFNTLPLGMQLSMLVRNIDGVRPRTFRAAIFGHAIRPSELPASAWEAFRDEERDKVRRLAEESAKAMALGRDSDLE